LQQKPSAQKVLQHSLPLLHVAPLDFDPRAVHVPSTQADPSAQWLSLVQQLLQQVPETHAPLTHWLGLLQALPSEAPAPKARAPSTATGVVRYPTSPLPSCPQ